MYTKKTVVNFVVYWLYRMATFNPPPRFERPLSRWFYYRRASECYERTRFGYFWCNLFADIADWIDQNLS